LQHIIRKCPDIPLLINGRPHILEEVKKYFPRHTDLTPIKVNEDIWVYLTMRLKKDLEPDVMDTRLEADILRII